MEIDLQISKTSLRLSKGKLGMNIHTHTTKYKIDNQWGSTYRTGTSPQYLYNLHCCSLVMSDSFVIPWTAVGQAPLSMGFPARILEWVAISFSRGRSWPRDRAHVYCKSPALQEDSSPLSTKEAPWQPVWEKNLTKNERVYVYIGTFCCTSETNTTL